MRRRAACRIVAAGRLGVGMTTEVTHRTIAANGIRIHVAESGRLDALLSPGERRAGAR